MKKFTKEERQLKSKTIIFNKDEELDVDHRTQFDKHVNEIVFKAAMDAYPLGYVDLDISKDNYPEVIKTMCEYGSIAPPPSIRERFPKYQDLKRTSFFCKSHLYHFSEDYMLYSKHITTHYLVDGVNEVSSFGFIWVIDHETQRKRFIGDIDVTKDTLTLNLTREFFDSITHMYPTNNYSQLLQDLLGPRITNFKATLLDGWKSKPKGTSLYAKPNMFQTDLVNNGMLSRSGIKYICARYAESGLKNPDYNFLKLYDITRAY